MTTLIGGSRTLRVSSPEAGPHRRTEPSKNRTLIAHTAFGALGGLKGENDKPPLVTLAPGEAASALLEMNAEQSSPAYCSTWEGIAVDPKGKARAGR